MDKRRLNTLEKQEMAGKTFYGKWVPGRSDSAAPGKEIPEDGGAFIGQDPGDNLSLVIQAGVTGDIHERAGGPRLVVDGPVDEPLDPCQIDGAGAHGARFDGHVYGAAGQTPAAELFGRLADCQHFSVGSGILPLLALVAGGRDHLSPPLDHGSDRDLAAIGGHAGLIERYAHEMLVFCAACIHMAIVCKHSRENKRNCMRKLEIVKQKRPGLEEGLQHPRIEREKWRARQDSNL